MVLFIGDVQAEGLYPRKAFLKLHASDFVQPVCEACGASCVTDIQVYVREGYLHEESCE